MSVAGPVHDKVIVVCRLCDIHPKYKMNPLHQEAGASHYEYFLVEECCIG